MLHIKISIYLHHLPCPYHLCPLSLTERLLGPLETVKNGNFSAPVVGSEPEKLVLIFFYLCQRFDRCKILGPPVQHALIKIILFKVFTLLPLPLFPLPIFVIILFFNKKKTSDISGVNFTAQKERYLPQSSPQHQNSRENRWIMNKCCWILKFFELTLIKITLTESSLTTVSIFLKPGSVSMLTTIISSGNLNNINDHSHIYALISHLA